MQMRITGFIENGKNICYVSHFQTYLQGSDYDIDKAYIMMSEIDKNGQYVGWSPLFNYTSIEYLKASELLPTPARNKFVYDANSSIDITNNIKLIQSLSGPEKLKAEAEFIKQLDKTTQRNNTNTLGVTLNIDILEDDFKNEAA